MQHLLADTRAGRTAFVIGSPAMHRHVTDAGLRVLNSTDLASRAEVVVVAGTTDLVYDDLRHAIQAVLRGADLLATARDPTYPQPDGLWPGTGAILAAVEYGPKRFSIPFLEVSRRGAVLRGQSQRALAATVEVNAFLQGTEKGGGKGGVEAAEASAPAVAPEGAPSGAAAAASPGAAAPTPASAEAPAPAASEAPHARGVPRHLQPGTVEALA